MEGTNLPNNFTKTHLPLRLDEKIGLESKISTSPFSQETRKRQNKVNGNLNFMFYSIAKGNYYASKISSNLVLFSDRGCEEPGRMRWLMAQRKKGLEVKIRTVPKVSTVAEAVEPSMPSEGEIYCTKEDLIHCSGLALGSPTRFWLHGSTTKIFS